MVVNEVKKEAGYNKYRFASFFLIGTIFSIVSMVFLIGNPLYKSVSKNYQTIKEKDDVIKKLETKLSALKKLSEREAELKEMNQKVLEAYPTDKDVSRLFVQIEQIGKQNGVIVRSATEAGSSSNSKKTSNQSFKEVKYSLAGTAENCESLKSFIAKTHEALRFVSLSNIKADSNKGKTELSLTLQLTTYIRSTE